MWRVYLVIGSLALASPALAQQPQTQNAAQILAGQIGTLAVQNAELSETIVQLQAKITELQKENDTLKDKYEPKKP